jgi:iron complex outermembrane receptor protein
MAVLTLAAAPTVFAQDAADRTSRPASVLLAQAGRTVTFNIPAQSLSQALTAFGRQTGLQIAVDTAAVTGKSTADVSGTMTSEEGLRQLLSGTGLSYQFTSTSAVTVVGGAAGSGVMQLEPLRVQGTAVPAQAMIDNLPPAYAGGQVATGGQVGLLGNRGVMDTPFNQTNYTAKTMQDQQAHSIADVVANDPSVRNMWSAVSYLPTLMIRGFATNSNDLSFGGLYGLAPAQAMPEYLERIEILKGPSALLNGMPPFGSIGGTINLIPKRAPDEALTEATVDYTSNGQVGGHLDFARRFGDDKSIGFRFNGTYRNGATPVDRQTQEIASAVFGLDFRGERTRLSFDYGYQKQRFNSPLRPTYVAVGVPVPTPPGGTANWFQPWSYMDSSDLFGAARLEFDVTPDWTIYGSAGARGSHFDSLMGFATITNANGNLTDAPFNFPGWANTNTEEVGLRGRVETGPIHHALTLSGTRLQLETGQLYPVVATIQSNLYTPTFIAMPNVSTLNPPKIGSTELTSLGFADVLSAVGDRIQLILGARYQRVQIGNYSSTTGAVTSYYDQSAISPAVGFVIKPWQNVSVYGNYIQGLQQGPTAPTGTTNAGQMFPPIQSRQFELGTKIDFGRFTTTVSAFQIEQPAGFTNPTTAAYSVDGMQRNQGLELNIFGEPLAGFRTLGGITLLDARQINTASALTTGKKATGVPDVQVNLGLEWDAPFLHGLTFSGRGIYTSMQYLDAANTQSIPAWTRFDAGVRYTFDRADGKPVSLRFNVENLFNANYWSAASSTYGLSMGAPRTFLLSLTSAF